MKKRFFPLVVILFLLSACQKDESKRVLLIGIDGLQYEQMQAIPTPNLDQLNFTKAYAGGITGTGTEQPTSSGPGWATLLTGVWANKHQVWSNDLYIADYHYPSFMFRTKLAVPSLSLSAVMNWIVPYFVFFIQEVPTLSYLSLGGDESVTSQAARRIVDGRSDVTFVHLDAPDHAGHAHGFSPEHTQAVVDSDRLIGELLAAVAQRQAEKPAEDWLVMVVTDHGRQPVSGFGHGSQTLEEKTVFIGVNKPDMNVAFSYQGEGLLYDDFDGLYGYPSQADVAPTIFRHLGISIQPRWKLEGVPLMGDLGVIRLMSVKDSDRDGVLLQWINSAEVGGAEVGSDIKIQRNGLLVATLASDETQYWDSSPDERVLDYVISANGVDTQIRVEY